MRVRDALVALVITTAVGVAGCSSDTAPTARPYPPGDAQSLSRAPSSAARTAPATVTAPMTPGQLYVAAIGINARVMPVGTRIQADPFLAGKEVTSFEVPPDLARVGWWRDGPMPGQRGMSILLGHSQVGGGSAVFNRLSELKDGDVIRIEDYAGDSALSFVVTDVVAGISKYDPAALQSALAQHSATSALALVTCSGDFESSVAESDANTVVFASRRS